MFKADSRSEAPQFLKFFRLEKMDEFQGIATGVAAAEEVDHDGEILDYFGSKPYFQKWSDSQKQNSGGKSLGNVRLQHDPTRPVGRLLDLAFDDTNRLVRVTAKVEEPVAKQLLETGVLTGFSIGGDYIKKTPLPNGLTRYVAGPSEISVCDRPCAPSAVYSVVKANGETVMRKFAKESTDMEDTKRLVLVKAIRAKLFPFTNPELEIEEVNGEVAKVWVEDRLIKVGFKPDAQGGFDIVSTARMSKAELRKDQAPDGTPMTVAEERAETLENGKQAQNRNMKLVDAAQVEMQTPPVANPIQENGEPTPEDPCKVKPAGQPAVAAVAAPSPWKAENGKVKKDEQDAQECCDECKEELENCECANKAAAAGDLDPLNKHSFKESQTKVKYLVPEERSLPYTDSKGNISHARMGAAWAALHEGYRGNKYGGKDKSGAIERLKGLYEKEGLDLPSEKAESNTNMEKFEADDASLEAMQAQLNELRKSAEEIFGKFEGEDEMLNEAQKAQFQKARKNVASHLADIQKALDASKAAHDRLHKAHDEMHQAYGVAHAAHKAAFDARAVHKAAMDGFHTKAASGIEEIKKVLGGGPESFGEFGLPDVVNTGVDPDGSQAASYAAQVPAVADKAVTAADVQKMIADGIKAGITEITKALKPEAAAAAPAAPAPAEETGNLSKAETAKLISDGIKQGLTEIMKAVIAEPEAPAAAGPGNRDARRPFSKVEEASGTGNGGAQPEEMTEKDWQDYRLGKSDAVKKAQRCTGYKWQAVPARLLARQNAR